MAVALQLGETLKHEPGKTKLNLSFRGLTDLTPLLPSLAAFKELNDLDLRGNALDFLPADLSGLPKLQTLDISQNPIAHAASVIPGLSSLPSLRYLSVALGAPEEASLLRSLPRLEALNGASLMPGRTPSAGGGSAPSTAPAVREIAMTEGDLESVALLYGGIKSLRGRISPQEDARLTSVFDTHIRTIMSDLKVRLDKLDDPFLRQGEILSAKYELYDVCFQQCIDHASSTSREFGSVLRKLRGIHQTLFSEFPRVVYDMKPVYDERVRVLETELDRAREETAQLLEAAELLESESQQQQDERLQERDAFESERESLLAEVESLRKEVQKLQGRAPAAASGAIRAPGRAGASLKGSAASGRRATGGAAGAGNGASHADGARRDAAPPPPAPATRVLTLKQLKEVIDAIYASKVKFDQKCAEAKLPRETMEQHMYTYLNQKYGLKALIIEHASSIIRAVNKYGKSDNDVGVFGRILRNEIDEEFRHVQAQLKESVEELLGVYLKGRFPLKTDKAIRGMLQERMQGHVFEEEWVDIIKYMYNQKDSLVLIVLVKDAIRSQEDRASPTPTSGRPRGVRGKIRFTEFLKILLDFQLKAHERFLSRFRQVFRSIDDDKNGIVDEAEFRALVTRISPTKTPEQLDELIRHVDPHGNAYITFSQCVNALSNELVKDAADEAM